MSDDIRVTNPVKIVSDSPQRVAFDLAMQVHHYEPNTNARDREYFLKLFSQCLHVVHGGSPKDALTKE